MRTKTHKLHYRREINLTKILLSILAYIIEVKNEKRDRALNPINFYNANYSKVGKFYCLYRIGLPRDNSTSFTKTINYLKL